MRLVDLRPGDVYSREKLQTAAKGISDRLGTEGYAFANVNAVPEVDREKHQARSRSTSIRAGASTFARSTSTATSRRATK